MMYIYLTKTQYLKINGELISAVNGRTVTVLHYTLYKRRTTQIREIMRTVAIISNKVTVNWLAQLPTKFSYSKLNV